MQLKPVENTEVAIQIAHIKQVQCHVLAMDLLYKHYSVLSADLWQLFTEDFCMSKTHGKMFQSSKKGDDTEVTKGFSINIK